MDRVPTGHAATVSARGSDSGQGGSVHPGAAAGVRTGLASLYSSA